MPRTIALARELFEEMPVKQRRAIWKLVLAATQETFAWVDADWKRRLSTMECRPTLVTDYLKPQPRAQRSKRK